MSRVAFVFLPGLVFCPINKCKTDLVNCVTSFQHVERRRSQTTNGDEGLAARNGKGQKRLLESRQQRHLFYSPSMYCAFFEDVASIFTMSLQNVANQYFGGLSYSRSPN